MRLESDETAAGAGAAAEKGQGHGVGSTAGALSTGGCGGECAVGAPYSSSAWQEGDH